MKRRGRALDGILILDKPAGMTSNRALQVVKRLYSAAKAGHTGSLDPLATGVLPLCLGEATKFSQFLLDADKGYLSTFIFGVRTNTSDAEGEVIANCDASALTAASVETALANFRGDIRQIPSMFSALKKDGQPLYKLARAGIEIEREARAVTVYELELVAFRPGERAEADVRILCSKGTYVRSIAEDVGQLLGVGAHVSVLRRTKAGPFTEADLVSMTTLEGLASGDAQSEMDSLLKPAWFAIGTLPKITLGEAAGFYLQQGQPVQVSKAPTSGLVQLFLAAGDFIGIGEILDDGRVAPKRLVVSQT